MPRPPLGSRATAFAVAFGLLALPSAPAHRSPSDPNLDLVRLTDRVYAAIRREPLSLAGNANSLIILRDSDVVVVDAQFTRAATMETIAAIRGLTRRPVSYVINTHWHDDHLAGDQVYRDSFPAVRFVMQANTATDLATLGVANRQGTVEGAPPVADRFERLLAMNLGIDSTPVSALERAAVSSALRIMRQYLDEAPGFRVIAADDTVQSRWDLPGHPAVQVRWFGLGNTRGDLVINLPEEHIVATGDLVVAPVPFAFGSNPVEWIADLDSIVALHPRILLPGHGPLMRDLGYLNAEREMLARARDAASAAVARGDSLATLLKSGALEADRRRVAGDEKWMNYLFSNFFLSPALGRAYEEAQATATTAPQPAAPDSAPSCATMLTLLRSQLETDYAGFQLEVKGDVERRYRSAFSSLARDAGRTQPDDCFDVLDRYVKWFHDPHLFIFQSADLDTAETRRRAAQVPRLVLSEAQAKADLDRRAGHLDPIEGIWYDGALRMAVVPEPGAPAGRFVAVVLRSDTNSWSPGAIRARFQRASVGSYRAQVWTRNYAMRRLDATIHKHVLLRLSPGMWGRAYPVDSAESPTVDTQDVHRPTIVLRDGAVVVSIPSHDPGMRPVLANLIRAHAADLMSADRLVVDLRGNEGGSSWMSDGLLPYIMTEQRRPTPYASESAAVMLSSPHQVAYARRGFGPDTSRFVRSLVERLEAHPGTLVRLRDSLEADDPAPRDSVIRGPRRVGVLTDGGTVSASEVLVLRALASQRATVFGEPTSGALDYQSIQIVRFAPGQARWFLGYPTIAASADLPAHGMRGHGIQPQVRLPLARLKDPIGTVLAALASAP